MEYSPRYPQPFTLTQAIALDPAEVWDEIARLKNSLLHLNRSQNELQQYLQEVASGDGDPEVSQALKENEDTIASQDERIFMLKLALAHHGYSVSSSESVITSPGRTDRPQVANNTISNALGDLETTEVDDREDGLYL